MNGGNQASHPLYVIPAKAGIQTDVETRT
jgi:hypothetical protein